MKTIIIYATKHGSVEHAVRLLKANLDGEVKLVNIMKEDPPLLTEFENVILGGSIYVGKIQKQLSKYVSEHLTELLTKRVGLFICAAQKEDIREKELADSYPPELYQHAICKEIFGFEINYDDMNFIEKRIVHRIMGYKSSYSELEESNIERFANAIGN